jgi:hypothetical protein
MLPNIIPIAAKNITIIVIVRPLKNLASRYSHFLKGYEKVTECISLSKSLKIVPPIMDGSKKNMITFISLRRPLIAIAELTMVTEFILAVIPSKIPAAVAIIKVDRKNMIPQYT